MLAIFNGVYGIAAPANDDYFAVDELGRAPGAERDQHREAARRPMRRGRAGRPSRPQRADNYSLAVVLFAASLFFAGISTRLPSRTPDALAMAVVALLANGVLEQMIQPFVMGATLGINPLAVLGCHDRRRHPVRDGRADMFDRARTPEGFAKVTVS